MTALLKSRQTQKITSRTLRALFFLSFAALPILALAGNVNERMHVPSFHHSASR